MNKAISKPGKMLLSPGDHTLIMIDFQSQMAFATKSIDAVTLRNNAALVANAAKIFNVSVIPTTVAEKSFSGPMFDEIKAAFPRAKFFDRTSMNTWEDKAVIEEAESARQEPHRFVRTVDVSMYRGSSAFGNRSGLRGLCDHRCLRRRLGRSARKSRRADGASRRAAYDVAAIFARTSARLGSLRNVRRRYRTR